VKRKRLDTGVQSKKVQVRKRKTSSKKKIEQQQPAGRKVKTRRVVTYADKVGNDDD